MIKYRKTKKGEWVAYGPSAELSLNGEVTITKASGDSVQRGVVKTGTPFMAGGVSMVYGYLTPLDAALTPSPRTTSTGGICDECDEPRRNLRACQDSSGITGMCCPRCAPAPAYSRSFA